MSKLDEENDYAAMLEFSRHHRLGEPRRIRNWMRAFTVPIARVWGLTHRRPLHRKLPAWFQV